MYIQKSVGRGGSNQKSDLSFIQELLNILGEEDARIPVLTIDGKFGKNTQSAIGVFQKHHVKLLTPDYRIDPNGRSEKTLISKIIEIDNSLVSVVAKKHGLTREKPSVSGSGTRALHYRSEAKKVLSQYSENIVKLAMGYAGINRCDISSTIRTIDDQVRIMYGNCQNFPSAKSVDSLRQLRGWGYAAPGKAVEEVYFANKTSGEQEIKKAMKEKIEALATEGKRVSLHCVPDAIFKKNNILDIPYSSVIATKRKAFETALMGMTEIGKVKNARYPLPTLGEAFISQLIIEDKCWHIEIAQNLKQLPNQKKPPAPRSKKNLKQFESSRTSIKTDCFNFLDDWY